jgi:hypothetical protein
MPQDKISSLLEKSRAAGKPAAQLLQFKFKQDEEFKKVLSGFSKLDENKKSEFLKLVKEEWDKASKDNNN